MTAREPVEGWGNAGLGGAWLKVGKPWLILLKVKPENDERFWRFEAWIYGELAGWQRLDSKAAAQLAAEDYAKQQLKAALDALENEK